MLRKIPCDWFLTDGILPDVRLGAPARIMDALMRAGVVKDDGTLISRLSREWVFRRSWRYYADFSAPKTEGTRVFLEMDGLFGKYTVRLNDKEIYKGDSEYLKAEATGVLNAENRIEIEIEPESNETMLPVSGLFGNLLVYDAGDVVIMKSEANYTTDMATVLSTVDAHCDGEVQILYTLTTEKGVREKKIYMGLSRGANEIEHSPFTDIGSGRTELEICIKKDGITADSARIVKYVSEDMRTLRGFRASDGFGMSAVRRVGGNAVIVGGSRRSYTLAADRGLTAFENGRITLTEAECALQKTEILEELCGGNTDMLEKEAIWRLSGVDKDVYMNAVSPVGMDADLEKKVNASRYRQAVCLGEKARKARLSGEGLMLKNIRDEAPVFASSAIFDKNERPRPAFYALMQAWGKEHAFAACPDEAVVDGICTVQAYYVCDGEAGNANVSVTVYGSNGCELAGGSFSVIGSGREAIGRVAAEVDDGPFIVVRTKVMHGFTVASVCDTVIPINGCTLADAEETQLVFKDNGIENVGGTAAIGVCIPGANYFGALLPGERVEIEPGRPDAAEGLNILY